MQALKTIVATAVIVFALTTVAMAGVQHLSRGGDGATEAGQASQAAAQPAAQGGVTLSNHQFAVLLRAAKGGGSQGGSKAGAHSTAQGRAHAKHQSQSHAASGAGDGSSAGVTHHTSVQHVETHHAAAHTTTHDGGTHDGGTHGGGEGCD